MNFSETSRPIEIKFHLEHNLGRVKTAQGFVSDRIKTQVTMATDWPNLVIMGKSCEFSSVSSFDWIFFIFAGIADLIGLPYFSGFPSGLKSHVLISRDFLSQSKFVPLARDRAAMCLRPSSKQQRNSVL